jgi:phospholipid N-methyltransferase
MGAKINFLREYISNPGSIGAVAPSGRMLASRMLDGISLESAATVVELGPGTGAYTTEILHRISSEAKFIAIEKNPVFLAGLRQRFENLEIIEGDAGNLVHLLHHRGIDAVDVVVSGLPWAAFPETVQQKILSEVHHILAPDGRFVTFAYFGMHMLPRARAFRNLLESFFGQVERTPLAWRNLPPAFAYHCKR